MAINEEFALLKRDKTKRDFSDQEIVSAVAVKSHELLGYDRLFKKSTTGSVEFTTRKTLAELGIEPLDIASVRAYQQNLLIKQNCWWNRFKNAFIEEYEWAWYYTPLKMYQQEIPIFALSRAVEIAEKCPVVTHFYVCSMLRNREVAYPDPFLVMGPQCEPGERYICGIRVGGRPCEISSLAWAIYLDVWDEPGFEGRRLV